MTETASPAGSPPRRRLALRRPGPQQIVGAVIVLMSLISILSVAWYNTKLERSDQCRAQYFQLYTDALQARDKITVASRQNAREWAKADKAMWQALLTNSPTEAGKRPTQEQRDASLAALQRYFMSTDGYLAALDNSDRARLTYPIPDNLCPTAGVGSEG